MNRTIAFICAFFVTSAWADEIDNRQALTLPAPQRHHVLTEMRDLLAGTQAILAALAKNDMAAVAESARAVGFDMKHKAENSLHQVLPKEFMQLGMSMHKDFDLIAADAESLKDPRHSLRQISETMAKCTACHAAYQINVGQTAEARLDEVAQRGSHVMPFDLEQTTHIFSKTENGGVQQVIVKDKGNSQQIRLIREHLAKIADEFAHGDFSNPAKIHGDTMPGLAELKKAGQGEITIDYQELADGAQIIYASRQPALVSAIHQWFDAQLSDHARHAMPGHGSHSQHKP